jgi:hypothetical protein
VSFHARLTPGVVTAAEPTLTLVLHSPERAAGVTLKLWELDTFVGADGKQVREGSKDDLLAEITGAIEPGPGKKQGHPEWRIFKVSETKIVGVDEKRELVAFRLQLPGHAETLLIPIVSEKGETEGRTFEIGFSLHQGGVEKLESKSPVLFTPPQLTPHAEVEGKGPLRLVWVCLGLASGEGLTAKLEVTGFARVDLHGRLVDAETGQPIPVRKGRKLYAYAHTTAELGVKKGLSRIPLALCSPLGDDGKFVHFRPAADPLGVAVLGMKREARDDGTKLTLPAFADAHQSRRLPPADGLGSIARKKRS